MTYVAPNPYSPYADADPLYRHLIPVLLPSLFGEPASGTLAATGCGRMAVVPDEPLRPADELDGPLPAGVCPACITAMTDGTTPPYAASDCRRCESATRHNGLCAQCRQEQHADWWDAQGAWARPFRLALPGKRVLDGAVFPNGQAVIIDDPVQGLSSGAPTLEQLVAGYHRAEVLLAEDVVRVGTARAQHAVQMYAEAAVELEDARRELARLDPFGDRHEPTDRTAGLLEAAEKLRLDAALRDTEGETTLAAYARELADLITPKAGCRSTRHCADRGWCHRCDPARSEAATEMRRQTEPAEAEAQDTCRSIEVDGQTISVRGHRAPAEQDLAFFNEVVRAAKRRYAAEHPAEAQAEPAPGAEDGPS